MRLTHYHSSPGFPKLQLHTFQDIWDGHTLCKSINCLCFKTVNKVEESLNHRMAWVEKDHNDELFSIPLLCAGSPTTRPGCPEPHPAWPWMPPGMGHPQPLRATCCWVTVWKLFLGEEKKRHVSSAKHVYSGLLPPLFLMWKGKHSHTWQYYEFFKPGVHQVIGVVSNAQTQLFYSLTHCLLKCFS